MGNDIVWAIVPVKSLQRTKSRLAAILTPTERVALTLQLLTRQLQVLSQVESLAGTLVVSRDLIVAEHAREQGCLVLAEEVDSDLNGAVSEARDILANEAIDHLLILPSDLPLISAEALQTMFGFRPKAAICSDRHGTGTNALLIPSNPHFQFQFGINSFHKHQAEFARHQIAFRSLSIPAIAFDLDTPIDWQQWQQMLVR